MNIPFLQRSKVISVAMLFSLVTMHSDMRSDSKQLDEVSYLREDTHVANSVARLQGLVRAIRPDASETECIDTLDELFRCICVIRNDLDQVQINVHLMVLVHDLQETVYYALKQNEIGSATHVMVCR